MPSLSHLLLGAALGLSRLAAANPEDGLPSYHYGAPIHVECMNRSSCVLSLGDLPQALISTNGRNIFIRPSRGNITWT